MEVRTSYSVFLLCIGCVTSIVAVMQDFYWRDYAHGDIPYDAIDGGDGKYIGQVYIQGHGIVPAAIYPHRNSAVAIFGKRVDIKEHIKILCAADPSKLYWKLVNFTSDIDTPMQDAVKGGFQDGYNLLIGMGHHEGQYKIGKVVDVDNPKLMGLYVWDKDGNKVRKFNLYLLKYNSTTPISAEYTIQKT